MKDPLIAARTYWLWKAREGRVAARLVTDPVNRLALLKMADIYERCAERSGQARFVPPSDRRPDAVKIA